jgi:nucleotide-binding universal stress UspA family protein
LSSASPAGAALASGPRAWSDLPLVVSELEVGPVARIVVGVDASPGALRALAWAADEARLRLASLQVVHAYHAQALAAPLYFPSMEALPGRAAAAGARPPEEEPAETLEQRAQFQAAVRRQAEDMLEQLVHGLGETVEGIDVRRSVVEDRNPAEALLELSADADLLVVGSRGRGGFSSLLLGSVSHQVVLHARCPVVVIPLGAEDRKAAAPLEGPG